MNKSLSDLRIDAFVRQAERCYYCTVLMWIDDGVSFARKHGLSSRVARWLKCTAEHLLARRIRAQIDGAPIRFNGLRVSPPNFLRTARRTESAGPPRALTPARDPAAATA